MAVIKSVVCHKQIVFAGLALSILISIIYSFLQCPPICPPFIILFLECLFVQALLNCLPLQLPMSSKYWKHPCLGPSPVPRGPHFTMSWVLSGPFRSSPFQLRLTILYWMSPYEFCLVVGIRKKPAELCVATCVRKRREACCLRKFWKRR